MGKLVFISREQVNGGDYRHYRHPTFGLIDFTTFELEPGLIWLEYIDKMAARRMRPLPLEPIDKPARKPRTKRRQA